MNPPVEDRLTRVIQVEHRVHGRDRWERQTGGFGGGVAVVERGPVHPAGLTKNGLADRART